MIVQRPLGAPRLMLESHAMSATRMPLLGAFAVGCLSSAALFGIWKMGTTADPSAHPRAANKQPLVAATVQRRAESPDPTPRTAPDSLRAESADQLTDAKDSTNEPAAPTADPANAAPPGGSAVSDVLMDLEAAYRQRLIAAARAEAEAASDGQAKDSEKRAAPVERAEVVAAATPTVAASAPATPPAPPRAAPAPEPNEPEPAVAPAPIARNDARAPDVHIGDVNQNTYITNVRQGDVYVVQQQLAMLQYMQLLGSSPYAGFPQPARPARGVAASPSSQFRQFPSTLTNLDNPWGFNFAPPNLVH